MNISTAPTLDHPQIFLVESVAPFPKDADRDDFGVTEAKDSCKSHSIRLPSAECSHYRFLLMP